MIRVLSLTTILLTVALSLSFPVRAQGPMGIGFAQAEEGTWWCRGDNTVATLDCARAECNAEAGGQDCFRTAWCYPARWSGLMTVWYGEFHGTQIICGAPSREALDAAFEVFCVNDEFAASCDLFLVIDPDGDEEEVFVSFTGGGAEIAP